MNVERFHKITRWLIMSLGFVLLIVIGIRLGLKKSSPQYSYPQTKPINYGAVSPFQFTNQNGVLFGSEDLKGSLWIADFIFTRCLGPCPIVTTKMANLHKEFSSTPKLKFVSFSVDPDYDQPSVLMKYAQTYSADTTRWNFLTGKKADIYALIMKSFHLAVEPTASETDIIHSLHFVVVDGAGAIRGYYDSTDAKELERLKKEIHALLSHD